ncbi:MAG: metallophosphoesterase, partial [Phycisphaerae bacterium]|nr:metallophosphoesterase [Phycisphaerae bacterium]
TNQATVEEINRTPNLDFVIHKGDVSSNFKEEELIKAKEMFDKITVPVYYVRGNHDRIGEDGEDYFKKVFGIENTWRKFEHKGFYFIILDSSNLKNGMAQISEEEFAWLEAELKASAAEKKGMWIFMHHAASEYSDFVFTLLGSTQKRFLLMVREAFPYVVGVFSGHSHRNKRVGSELAYGVEFVETCATKDFPGCWTEVRVYTQGWLQINHSIDCPECREWFDMTTDMYNGKAQEIKSGLVPDKCFSVEFADELKAEEEAQDSPDASTEADDLPPVTDEKGDDDSSGCSCRI